MNWVQWVVLLGGGATSGVLLGQVLAFCRYTMKHRALLSVIDRENSTPAEWQAAAAALATIDNQSRAGPTEIPASPADATPPTRFRPLAGPPIPIQRTRWQFKRAHDGHPKTQDH